MGSTLGKHGWLPQARADALLAEQVGDETVVYDLNTKQVHCLSPLAAAVYERCDGRTPAPEIAEFAQKRIGSPVTPEDVSNALDQLQERALLDDPPQILLSQGGFSRRDLVRKAAVVGAAAAVVPLITSVSAASAGTTDTLQPPGGPCGQNKDCASGHCCQDHRDCNPGLCVACDNACNFRTPSQPSSGCIGACDDQSTEVCCRCTLTPEQAAACL